MADEIIDINTMFGPMPTHATDLSVEDLARMMERHRVRSCFTLSTVGMLLDHNVGNAATRAACAENPALLPVATMNPQTWFGGEGPFTRFAADGYRMARFFPNVQGWEPDYAPFAALSVRLEAERLPVMVEANRPGMASRTVQALLNHPARIILSGVDERCAAEAVALMRRHETVYIETSDLLATGLLRHVVEAVGADRVLYGSGAPSRPMAGGLQVVRHSGLSEADCARVLGANARELLRI